jgi:hypothetical protein
MIQRLPQQAARHVERFRIRQRLILQCQQTAAGVGAGRVLAHLAQPGADAELVVSLFRDIELEAITQRRQQALLEHAQYRFRRGIRGQLDERLTHSPDPALRTALEAARARLSAIEDSLYNPRLRSSQDPLNFPIRLNNKMAALLGVVESAEAAPTRQSYTVFADLSHRIGAQLAALDALVRSDLPRLNALLRARGLAEVRAEPDRPAPEPPRPGGDDEDEDDEDEEEEEEEVKDW